MKKVIVISTSLRPGATHCDLYDGSDGNCIPLDTLAEFFGDTVSKSVSEKRKKFVNFIVL